MAQKYTDLSVVYELREKRKYARDINETVIFSLILLRFVSTNNLLVILKDKSRIIEIIKKCKDLHTESKHNDISVSICDILQEYISLSKNSNPRNYSHERLAKMFIKMFDESPSCFPPLDLFDITPKGRTIVYSCKKIA